MSTTAVPTIRTGRARTNSSSPPLALSTPAPDALYNLNLLSALRTGDPARIHPFLADLSSLSRSQQQAAKRLSSRGPPVSGSGSGRTSMESDRSSLIAGKSGGGSGSKTPESVSEMAAYMLHLAVRVASCPTLSLILSHKLITPNLPYKSTTPLHLAASLGREDVVRLLLEQEDVDDTIRDGSGRSVIEVAASPRLAAIIQESRSALHDTYTSLLTSYILAPPTSPPPSELLSLLRSPRATHLDLTALTQGTTLLHTAARRAHLDVIELAAARGADLFVRDARGKGVLDVCGKDERVRAFLRQFSNQDPSLLDPSGASGAPPNLKGYLNKYTNVAHGYSSRWFVLQDGVLSYYRTQADYPHSCRGSLHTGLATIKTSSSDKLRLEVSVPSGSKDKEGQRWFLRAEHVGEAGRWAQALRRNAEWWRRRVGGGGGAGEEEGGRNREAAGPFLRKGFTRTLSGTFERHLKRRSVDASGGGVGSSLRAPSGDMAAGGAGAGGVGSYLRTKSNAGSQSSFGEGARTVTPPETEMEMSGAERAGESDGDRDEGTDESGEGEGEPPMGEWEGSAEAARAQVEALRALVGSPLGEGEKEREKVRAALQDALAGLLGTVDSWRGQQQAREKWYEGELEKERQARALWEESLGVVVGESEKMEGELRREAERRRQMRRELAGSEGGRGTVVGAGEVGPPVPPKTIAERRGERNIVEPAATEQTPAPGLAPPMVLPLSLPSPTSEPQAHTAAPADEYESDEDDDEFFDAIESGAIPNLVLPSPLAHPSSPSPSSQTLAPASPSFSSFGVGSSVKPLFDLEQYTGYAHPRERLPIESDDRPPVSLWAVLKGSIGKDLTKISFPVYFNEPTSMLQRMAEDMEFSECLDAAAMESDPHKRIAFVAAFAMSNYSSTIGRIAKPFNPMLSETFEYCHLDKHYRYVSEQVSHHPPISACWCEAPEWLYYGEVDAKNKFMGKSFEIRPTGAAFADLKLSPEKVDKAVTDRYPRESVNGVEKLVEHYSWKKVTTNVSGFILGNPTIDHYGDMTVVNHRTGDTCVLTFKPRGWRGKDANEIKGKVMSASGDVTWQIAGRWSSQLVARRATGSEDDLLPDVSVASGSEPQSPSMEYILLWRNTTKPPAPFNLTPYAITLNDLPENTLKPYLPPTDCRMRPDQRAFEQGRYELANELKSRQEDEQRTTRKKRETGELPPHQPRWFVAQVDEDSGERVWKPKRRDGQVEYWCEREKVWKLQKKGAKAEWDGVERIFIEA